MMINLVTPTHQAAINDEEATRSKHCTTIPDLPCRVINFATAQRYAREDGMRFLVLGVVLATWSSVQQHVGAVSASDSIILSSALEEAIDTMRANSETGSSSSVNKVGQKSTSGPNANARH